MTQQELKKADDSVIIMEYIHNYAMYVMNYNYGGGIKMYDKKLKFLDGEMIRRGILSEEQVNYLNM